MPWDELNLTLKLQPAPVSVTDAPVAADPDPSLEAFRAALEGKPAAEAAAPAPVSVTEVTAPAEPAPVEPEPTEEATEEEIDTDLLIAAAATPDPTTPLTAEQQAQARAWVGAMASAAQRKAFAAAFRHAFSVDPAEKSVAPLITQWQHYAFVDRFVIEAAGGVAA